MNDVDKLENAKNELFKLKRNMEVLQKTLLHLERIHEGIMEKSEGEKRALNQGLAVGYGESALSISEVIDGCKRIRKGL